MDSILPTDRADLLLFASNAPAFRGLRQTLGERIDGAVRGVHVSGKTIGVGMAAVGASVAKRLLQLRPRAALLVGTCGVYPGLPDYRPHDIVVGTQVRLLDHAVLEGRATFPEPMLTSIVLDPTLTSAIAGAAGRARRVAIASPLSMTTDDRSASSVPSGIGCEVECLEAMAVAQTCNFLDIPCAMALAVTHVVGSSALNDARTYERDATLAVGEAVLRWLHQGAQGIPHG